MVQKVMIFINGSNMFHSCKNRGIKVDYELLAKFLLEAGGEGSERILIRKYLYYSRKVPPTKDQIDFENALKYRGWELTITEVVTRLSWGVLASSPESPQVLKTFKETLSNGEKKALEVLKECIGKLAGKVRVPIIKEQERGVDVALTTDLVSMGYQDAYDVAIVVGAEEDFGKALREVKRLGKRLELASFSETISSEIRKEADRFIALEDHIDKFLLKEKKEEANVFKIKGYIR